MYSGSGPPRMPVSSRSIAVTSSGDNAKSKTSKFSAMRCGLTDFGIAEMPCSMCQRRTTCADVFRCFAASSRIVGCSSGFLTSLASVGRYLVTPPSGDHAWVTMPFEAWKSRSACWVKNGCSSTWLTAQDRRLRPVFANVTRATIAAVASRLS